MSGNSMMGTEAQDAPFFSICIPQYNRTEFLIEACRSYASQSFRSFEVCISDDCSTDGMGSDLIAFLEASGLRYRYLRTSSNLRYDGNLRSAIGMSSGRYLLLMGNDDRLSGPNVLQEMHDAIAAAGEVAAAICNYVELSTGARFRRMQETAVLGSGPDLAVAVFRNYSFVSGVVLHGPDSRAEATNALDGSEMYQMYLGARLVGRGGRFLALDHFWIEKDIQIAGQAVDSYAMRARVWPCPIIKRRLPMGRLLEVVAFSLRPCVEPGQLGRLLFRVGRDLYLFTYPFWGVEYRRVQSWRYALGIMLALEPGEIVARGDISAVRRAMLWAVYLATTTVALTMPVALFDRLRPMFYALAKRGSQDASKR